MSLVDQYKALIKDAKENRKSGYEARGFALACQSMLDDATICFCFDNSEDNQIKAVVELARKEGVIQ